MASSVSDSPGCEQLTTWAASCSPATVLSHQDPSRGFVVSIVLNSPAPVVEIAEPVQQQQQVHPTVEQEEETQSPATSGATVLRICEDSSTSSCQQQRDSASSSSDVGRDVTTSTSAVNGSITISVGSTVDQDTLLLQCGSSSPESSGPAAMVRPGHFFYFPESHALASPTSDCGSSSSSGAGSDLDGSATPLSCNKRKQQAASPVDSGVSSVISHQLTDEDEDSISCDSLNSSEGSELPPLPQIKASRSPPSLTSSLQALHIAAPPALVRTYEERAVKEEVAVEEHHHYEFHLKEGVQEGTKHETEETDTFAGVRDVLGDRGAIKSARGTVRGVKNRVRAGIATFLQMEDSKSFKDREQGKLVVYTTTMGVVRATYLRCVKVKQILRTLLVKFEERDVFMSRDTQTEVRARMRTNTVQVPQVFLEGHHLGDADTIERLNESGELRRLLRPFKCPGASVPCSACGGYRLLPCLACNGSKKSVHRNHFTAEFVALKCMACDESGLMRCNACAS